MYKVMLVDDDYPVLELLSNTIPWSELGLELIGLYENGALALESAKREMPDMVVTDIGMPKMDGLELVRELKAIRPDLRVAILSCHSEFQYAQQAMKMNIQDYLLKDTLDPADVRKLLEQFKTSLDEETNRSERQKQLRHMVDRSRERHKEAFIRGTIHDPMLSEEAWELEAEALGLHVAGRTCLPIALYIDGQRAARQRFVSDDVLRFAIHNIVEEVLREEEPEAVHFTYDALRSFIMLPYHGGIKTNPYDRAAAVLGKLQTAVERTLKLQLSFLIGVATGKPAAIRHELAELLGSSGQRFYMMPRTIEKKAAALHSTADLFGLYDDALNNFREMMIGGNPANVRPVVGRWIGFLRESRFRPETVKDWMLKLVLDLKLKLQSMQMFRSQFSVDILHREILETDTLAEMENWLIDFFESSLVVVEDAKVLSKRSEVLDACHYVSLHLHRKIGLDEVAESLFMNPSYFSRLFKKETGETFIEYVNRMKVNRAKELLDQTNLSVAKIGEALGYDNHSYFIKMFKSVAGFTPQEYRNGSHKGEPEH
ncbi:two-component system, response regulator YesN [Paenibacillus sp. UNCCL117]|uniref:response regulator transcription factor n=1 Tax=unclassified Paenibacillus TaxID=185978 RepID=UPI0008848C00|nr:MULTISPECIES: helix-turn-helix domain-containing protein [unclassified Paenibacillus]SDC63622.1 two-component system, response regulator YesN [Paenibacillus sp. cl123]SFW22341.1 two-component system, response regulator YesN [Paenibacillus sp. UNCCL117]